MSNWAYALFVGGLGGVWACLGPAPEVEGTYPARRNIESALTTNGRIEARAAVAVRAATAGRVGKLHVRRGSRIRRGDPLLELVDAGQMAARARASATLDGATARLVQLDAGLDPLRRAELGAEVARLEAQRRHASEDLDRLRRLLARDAVARSEVDRHERAVQDLTAGIAALNHQLQAPPAVGRRAELTAAIRAAETELQDAERSVRDLALRAPADGTLFSLVVQEGDFLEYGSLVARIGTTASVTARIFLDEPELGRVVPGAVARLTADAYPGREWTCRVETLATEVIDLGARRVGEVLCRTDNPERMLLPGLAVRVRVVIRRAEQVLSVPRAAVLRSDAHPFVWTVEDGRAVPREVSLGVIGPVHAEIASGLTESDAIAIPGDRSLAAGQRLRLRPATLEGGAGHPFGQ